MEFKVPLVKPRKLLIALDYRFTTFQNCLTKRRYEKVCMEQFSQLTTLSMVSTTRVKSFKFWVLRFRDLGASCFGLRFRVLRFRNYRVSPLQKLLLSRTSGHGQAKQITKPIIQFSSHFTKAKSSSNAVLKRKLEES